MWGPYFIISFATHVFLEPVIYTFTQIIAQHFRMTKDFQQLLPKFQGSFPLLSSHCQVPLTQSVRNSSYSIAFQTVSLSFQPKGENLVIRASRIIQISDHTHYHSPVLTPLILRSVNQILGLHSVPWEFVSRATDQNMGHLASWC